MRGRRCYCTAFEDCAECTRVAELEAEHAAEVEAEEHAEACEALETDRIARCRKCRTFTRLEALADGRCAKCADEHADEERRREAARAGRVQEALGLEDDDIPF